MIHRPFSTRTWIPGIQSNHGVLFTRFVSDNVSIGWFITYKLDFMTWALTFKSYNLRNHKYLSALTKIFRRETFGLLANDKNHSNDSSDKYGNTIKQWFRVHDSNTYCFQIFRCQVVILDSRLLYRTKRYTSFTYLVSVYSWWFCSHFFSRNISIFEFFTYVTHKLWEIMYFRPFPAS